jgi:hypothetical protein
MTIIGTIAAIREGIVLGTIAIVGIAAGLDGLTTPVRAGTAGGTTIVSVVRFVVELCACQLRIIPQVQR